MTACPLDHKTILRVAMTRDTMPQLTHFTPVLYVSCTDCREHRDEENLLSEGPRNHHVDKMVTSHHHTVTMWKSPTTTSQKPPRQLGRTSPTTTSQKPSRQSGRTSPTETHRTLARSTRGPSVQPGGQRHNFREVHSLQN